MAFNRLTERLKFSLLQPGQLLADVLINENLIIHDVFTSARFISHTVSAEPASPAKGDLYILPSSGVTGTDWQGHDGELAWYFGGWRFRAPTSGDRGWLASLSEFVIYDGTNWKKHNGTDWSTNAF